MSDNNILEDEVNNSVIHVKITDQLLKRMKKVNNSEYYVNNIHKSQTSQIIQESQNNDNIKPNKIPLQTKFHNNKYNEFDSSSGYISNNKTNDSSQEVPLISGLYTRESHPLPPFLPILSKDMVGKGKFINDDISNKYYSRDNSMRKKT